MLNKLDKLDKLLDDTKAFEYFKQAMLNHDFFDFAIETKEDLILAITRCNYSKIQIEKVIDEYLKQ